MNEAIFQREQAPSDTQGLAGKLKLRLFHGDKFAGDVVAYPLSDNLPIKLGDEIKVSSLSPPSERCLPLVVLHSIATDGVLFKLEPVEPVSPETNVLLELHSFCFKEFKTAVALLEGGKELHLVAMQCKREQWPCFWVFQTTAGLYTSCLSMLNLRCLALVFDLDETLIVANTMRSFEDRIEALDRKIRLEADLQKVATMSEELKRYQEDKVLLKQFVDYDHVWDTGSEKLIISHNEVVKPLVEGNAPLVRPIVRLQERNMVFTRINPNVRDTSVLVRIRPAWEDLKSYLTAKGRKRFEVFICTMSEKDYALEMWRLLDPEAQLIDVKELVERVVCVKSGGKKSLGNVFSRGRCHPKMAMVIDDRLKVWEDRDQSHVHVVPAFAPYYAPQAEVNNPVPILCVARNVACNARVRFFKDFDEGFSKKMSEVFFENDILSLAHVPDVSNYLFFEEDEGRPQYEVVNGVKEFSDGVADAEVERSLKPQVASTTNIPAFTIDMEVDSSLSLGPSRQAAVGLSDPPSQSSPAQDEGQVPESELDTNTRRRLLILQHGQDTGQPHNSIDNTADLPSHSQSSLQPSLSLSVATPGGWLEAEDEEAYFGEERHNSSSAIMDHSHIEKDDSQSLKTISSLREIAQQSGRPSIPSNSNFVEALQNIAQQCNTKVDFKPLLSTTKELRFSVEVHFGGDKISEGIGKTKKEATHQAAENAVKFMASQFVAQTTSDSGQVIHTKAPTAKLCEEECTDRWNSRDPRILSGLMPTMSIDDMATASASNQSKILDSESSVEPSRPYDAVYALKKWCIMEGLNVVFKASPMAVMDGQSQQVQALVEVAGQIVARGSGATWEAAKHEAAEEALANLKSTPFQRTSQKRIKSPRHTSFQLSRRARPDEYSRHIQRHPVSPQRRSPPRRYGRNGPPSPL